MLGTIVVSVLFAIFPSVDKLSRKGGIVSVLISITTYFFVLVIIWVVSALFKGAYNIQKAYEKRIVELESKLFPDFDPDDQPIDVAINYITDFTDFGVRKTVDQICHELFRLGAGARIAFSGQPGTMFLNKNYEKTSEDYCSVPANFLTTCYLSVPEGHNEMVLAEPEDLSQGNRSGDPIRKSRIYWGPRVSMSDIAHHFPSKFEALKHKNI